jgi:hypothetical protein
LAQHLRKVGKLCGGLNNENRVSPSKEMSMDGDRVGFQDKREIRQLLKESWV